jgi:hypothetical protein
LLLRSKSAGIQRQTHICEAKKEWLGEASQH